MNQTAATMEHETHQTEDPQAADQAPEPVGCPDCGRTDCIKPVESEPGRYTCEPCMLTFSLPPARVDDAGEPVKANGVDPELVTGSKRHLHLPVKLPAEEIERLVHECAEAADEIDDLESDLKIAKARVKGIQNDIEAKQQRISRLVRICDTGVEERSVECQDLLDYRDNAVRTVRLDTGDVVNERAMRDDERQLALMPADEEREEDEPDADRLYDEDRDAAGEEPVVEED